MTVFESAARWPGLLFRWFRAVSGDDAYDRYLEHWRRHHADESPTGEKPMTRRDFFRLRENERWNGVRRCC